MALRGIQTKETIIACTHCQELYDLAVAARSVRKGKIRCPHCNKTVGSI